MSKFLQMRDVKPSSYTNDAFPLYKIKPAFMKEYKHPVTKDSQLANVSGTGSEGKIEFTDPNEQGVIDDLIFEFKATITGADNCTFPNEMLIFDELELFEEGISIDHLRNQDEIRARVGCYEREQQPNIYSRRQRSIDQTGTGLNGITVTNGVTNYFSLSMLPIFYYLRGTSTRSFKTLKLKYRFAVDGGTSATTGAFCVSSSTVNTYALISYSNITLRSIVYRNTDTRLEVDTRNFTKVIDKFQSVLFAPGPFNTADVDKFTIKTKTDFASTNSCKGIFLWFESPSNRTTYNDADNGLVVSLPETICIEVRYNSNVLFSHLLSGADLVRRRRYNYDVQERRWSQAFHEVAMANSNLNKYLMPICYIDLTNILIHEFHEVTLTGISNENNIEIDVRCGTVGVHATNAVLHAVLHYIETVTKPNNIPVINLNPNV